MFELRPSQLDALADEFLPAAIDAVYEESSRSFPTEYGLLEADGFRALIEHCFARARSHEIDVLSQVHRYSRLVFLLGGHFDTDPLLPWAEEILADRERGARRLPDLVERAAVHVHRIAGPDGACYRRALARCRGLELARLHEVEPSHEGLWELASEVFPERAGELDEHGIEQLVAGTTAECDAHALPHRAGRALLVVLRLLLGAHVLRDPLHPWAAEAVKPSGRGAGLEALHAAAMQTLEAVTTPTTASPPTRDR